MKHIFLVAIEDSNLQNSLIDILLAEGLTAAPLTQALLSKPSVAGCKQVFLATRSGLAGFQFDENNIHSLILIKDQALPVTSALIPSYFHLQEQLSTPFGQEELFNCLYRHQFISDERWETAFSQN